jgi:hypothetical protein
LCIPHYLVYLWDTNLSSKILSCDKFQTAQSKKSIRTLLSATATRLAARARPISFPLNTKRPGARDKATEAWSSWPSCTEIKIALKLLVILTETFCCFPQSSRQIPEWFLKWRHGRILPLSFHFTVYVYLAIRRCVIRDADSLVKWTTEGMRGMCLLFLRRHSLICKNEGYFIFYGQSWMQAIFITLFRTWIFAEIFKGSILLCYHYMYIMVFTVYSCKCPTHIKMKIQNRHARIETPKSHKYNNLIKILIVLIISAIEINTMIF